jgi:hypothetical protein
MNENKMVDGIGVKWNATKPLPCGHPWYYEDAWVVGGCSECCNEREEAYRKSQEAK